MGVCAYVVDCPLFIGFLSVREKSGPIPHVNRSCQGPREKNLAVPAKRTVFKGGLPIIGIIMAQLDINKFERVD